MFTFHACDIVVSQLTIQEMLQTHISLDITGTDLDHFLATHALLFFVSSFDEPNKITLYFAAHNLDLPLENINPLLLSYQSELKGIALLKDSVTIIKSRFFKAFLTELSDNLGPNGILPSQDMRTVVFYWRPDSEVVVGRHLERSLSPANDLLTPDHIMMKLFATQLIFAISNFKNGPDEPQIDYRGRLRLLCDKYIKLAQN